MMKLIAAVVIASLLPSLALAQPLPQRKPPGPGGSCPHGYTSSGSFRVPREGAARDSEAAERDLSVGWTASGSYCLRSGSRR